MESHPSTRIKTCLSACVRKVYFVSLAYAVTYHRIAEQQKTEFPYISIVPQPPQGFVKLTDPTLRNMKCTPGENGTIDYGK